MLCSHKGVVLAMKRNQKQYDKLIHEIRPILTRHYGADLSGRMIRDMEPIYDRFLAETPSIGGRKNTTSKNMDMALPFFALYEASGRTLSGKIIEEMIDQIMVAKYRKIGRWIDMNKLDRPWFRSLVYSMARKVADKNNAHKGKDWNNIWGIQINPEGYDHGLAMTLVGCPLADFAKSHGYLEIIPCLCRSDIQSAAALHARLIRHHTVAQGYETCDYWYVGDRDPAADHSGR